MKREEALLEIDFYREKGTDYLKVKDVSMYFIINKIFDEHEAEIKAKDERIKELEEAMKPKTCDGCKFLNGVICKHDRGLYCVRQFEEDYFQPKDNA